MKAKEWDVFIRAVEEGVAYGITRLFKYHDSEAMTEETLRENADRLTNAVISSVCEWFDFEQTPEEE